LLLLFVVVGGGDSGGGGGVVLMKIAVMNPNSHTNNHTQRKLKAVCWVIWSQNMVKGQYFKLLQK